MEKIAKNFLPRQNQCNLLEIDLPRVELHSVKVSSLALRAKLTSLNPLVIFKSLSLVFPHLRSQAGKIYLYFVDEFLKCVIMFLNIYAC